MARIPRDIVETIRDRTNLVEIVSRHVQLQRKGKDFLGLCPFHDDNKPSFYVVPDRAMYHCFACQASGDVFRFLQEIEGLSFVEAVKELAEPAGVTIEERELTPEERRRLKQRATLYDVLTAADSWFQSRLWTSSEGEAAREYLEGRGITEELARKAGLGFAPEGWTRLLDHLQSEGFEPGLIAHAGLAKIRERDGSHYDAFRNRVMVPIRDDRSRTIAFGGRLMEGDGPKYINSQETPLYRKKHVWYGLDLARRAIGSTGRAIVVEGYFDVLSMHQAGFAETIAACGTAITKENLDKLKRLTQDVVLLTDADEAGSRAAEKALPMFVAAGLRASRLDLPDAKDPDEFIQAKGADAMSLALQRVTPLLEWVIDRKQQQIGYDAQAAERIVDELLDVLAHLSGAAVPRVSRLLGYDQSQLAAKVERARRQRTSSAPTRQPSPEIPGWKPNVEMSHLLWLLVHRYDEVADLMERVPPELLSEHAPVRPAIARLVNGEPVASVITEESEPHVRRTLEAVVARQDLYDREGAALGLVQILNRLAEPMRARKLAMLRSEIQRFRRDNDASGVRDALRHIAALQRQEKGLREAIARRDPRETVELLYESEAANA